MAANPESYGHAFVTRVSLRLKKKWKKADPQLEAKRRNTNKYDK